MQIQLAEEREELHLGREVRERAARPTSVNGTSVLYSFEMSLCHGPDWLLLRRVRRSSCAVSCGTNRTMIELSSKATVPVLWKQDDSVLENLDIMAGRFTTRVIHRVAANSK